MKQSRKSSKGSASMEGSNGDFDKELQSGHHNHTYNNCNIHHHHYHFLNEANSNEEQNPPFKQADEEQKLTEKNPHTQALPNNDGFPAEKPYVLIQSGANPNIHNHYNTHHHHHYHNQNEGNDGEEKEPKEQQHCLKESLPVNDIPSNGDEEEKPIEITQPAETLPINSTPSTSIDLVHSPTKKRYVRIHHQAAPVNATPSSTDEEQKPVENISPPQALPISDSPKVKPYVRIQSGANTNYFLSVRDGKVIAALFDLNDESQHWYLQHIKITRTHDCAFLVNKSTGKALKYSDEDHSRVQLVTYNPQVLYRSTLWTNLGSRWLSPLDYRQYTLEANFSSGGAFCDGYPVFINRTALNVFTSNPNTNSKVWEIIDYFEPVVLA